MPANANAPNEEKALKKIAALEKKMLRAEKKKFEAEQRKIQKLKAALFPNKSLQERTENISVFYAKYGKGIFDILLKHSNALDQKFAVLQIKE